MDHDEKVDSMATVTMKEYPPSESYSSEPPPAYQKPKSSAVQIARIAALTVVACSVILGSFILGASWISASMSCQHHAIARQDGAGEAPHYQSLVDPLQSEESRKETVVPAPAEEDNEVHLPFQFKVPLTLDFDELAGSLMERNQRSRMNCVVEKKHTEEVVDHKAKTVRLPFGVNVTTDPRHERVTGEKMMIFCESGQDQRHVPMEQPSPPAVPLPIPQHFAGPMTPPQQQQQQQRHPQRMPSPVPNMQLLQHILQHHQQQMQQEQQQEDQEQEGPTLIHTTIHVGEEREVPVVETRAFRHPIPIPIQVTEERVEGRAFLRPIAVPFEEGRRGRAFAHPVSLPIQVSEEGRQGRAFQHPVQIPVQVQQQQQQQQQQQHPGVEARVFHAHLAPDMARSFPRLPVHVPQVQQGAEEQHRPHYVQPRSVRSVDDVLHRREKRVRRCACNCDC